MARRATLVARIAASLRADLGTGALPPGARLPTEHDLAARFEVSRATVRAALRELEAIGLVRTQHGVGTFVREHAAVRAGLERMGSITDSIRAMGREPATIHDSRLMRRATPDETARMGGEDDQPVIELRRTILADDEVVAWSWDLLPLDVLPSDVGPEDFDGSVFAVLRDQCDIDPDHSLARVHAVASDTVGWGPQARDHDLFLLLDQLHYDRRERLVLYSRTWFIEGRYAFTILRRG